MNADPVGTVKGIGRILIIEWWIIVQRSFLCYIWM